MRRVDYHFTGGVITQAGVKTEGGTFLEAYVDFDMEIDGVRSGPYSALVKSAAGGDFFDDPLEVATPSMYHGPFNLPSFQICAEEYVRRWIGKPRPGKPTLIAVHDANDLNVTDARFDVPYVCGGNIGANGKPIIGGGR